MAEAMGNQNSGNLEERTNTEIAERASPINLPANLPTNPPLTPETEKPKYSLLSQLVNRTFGVVEYVTAYFSAYHLSNTIDENYKFILIIPAVILALDGICRALINENVIKAYRTAGSKKEEYIDRQEIDEVRKIMAGKVEEKKVA